MTSTRKGRPASPSAPSQAGQERWRLQIGRYEPRNDNIVNILSDYVVQFAARTPPGYDSTHLVDRQEAIDTPFQVSTRYLERKSLQSLRLEAGRPSEASDGLSVPRSVGAHAEACQPGSDAAKQTPKRSTSLFTTRVDF